jgi:hypothetical protein
VARDARFDGKWVLQTDQQFPARLETAANRGQRQGGFRKQWRQSTFVIREEEGRMGAR